MNVKQRKTTLIGAALFAATAGALAYFPTLNGPAIANPAVTREPRPAAQRPEPTRQTRSPSSRQSSYSTPPAVWAG